MDHQLEIVLTVRGRHILPEDLLVIQQVVNDHWSQGRSFISRQICKSLDWYQQNGWLKDRACRDILRVLEDKGMIKLPPSKQRKSPKPKDEKSKPAKTVEMVKWETNPIDECTLTNVTIQMVRWGPNEKLWNSLVQVYHYQGHSVIVGRYLKYILSLNGIPLACIALGGAAWHLSDRDRWIGWNNETRRYNLERIINNVRFLILPWVHIPNFASFVLAKTMKIATKDWYTYYKVTPFLAETFVENRRFIGTCYKASNWIRIGTTKGFSRKGYSYSNHQVPKDIYVFPLVKNARAKLNTLEADNEVTVRGSRTQALADTVESLSG